MAFTAALIEIALKYTCLGQNCITARCYEWDGLAIATATPAQLGEGWWNHYKDAWRDLAPGNVANAQFLAVAVREVGGSLSYGEYAIPTGEQEGTRTSGEGSMLPSYVAVGCRLTVNSSVTRPGQVRFPFLLDSDQDGNNVDAAFLTLCDPLASLYSEHNILGSPVATGEIIPQVVSFGIDNNTVDANQEVVGYVLNPFVTSQVSRRKGHGN